jgi:AcrR family transcriptional regulator
MAMKRKYALRKRAEQVAETRRRITEAAIELHGTVGPAGTRISEVARRAGVQRVTVYNHFPDDASLFAACSAHWRALHPGPDPAAWAGIEDSG